MTDNPSIRTAVNPCLKLHSPETGGRWEIPVLHEDADLLVLDKPSQLLLSPDSEKPESPCLMALLHQGIEHGAGWAKQRGWDYLMNVHRADFETSGVVILAKSKPVLIGLSNLFNAEKPLKTCVALVKGAPKQEEFEINAKIAPHPTRPGLVRIGGKDAKKACTRFKVREYFKGFSLMECRPLHERQHQVRVHLAWSGCPVAGDIFYGGSLLRLSSLKGGYRLKPGQEERPLISSPAVHVESVSIPHPRSKEPLVFAAGWPKDLRVAVKYLRLLAPAN